MSRSNNSKSRHHDGHHEMKRNYNRKLRRLAKFAIRNDDEAPIKMPGFVARGFCCGNHISDWRY